MFNKLLLSALTVILITSCTDSSNSKTSIVSPTAPEKLEPTNPVTSLCKMEQHVNIGVVTMYDRVTHAGYCLSIPRSQNCIVSRQFIFDCLLSSPQFHEETLATHIELLESRNLINLDSE